MPGFDMKYCFMDDCIKQNDDSETCQLGGEYYQDLHKTSPEGATQGASLC